MNFLPIPVLDGGHMMFLIFEGIRGKPLNEKWQMGLTVAGLFMVMGLMVGVMALDLTRYYTFWTS
jgi:regulator of sigma E protease